MRQPLNTAFLALALLSPTAVSAGQVVGWGENTDGQLNFPTNGDFSLIAAGGFQSLFSLPDGSILISHAPSNTLVQADTNRYGLAALTAGYAHGLALRGNGALEAFGNNEHGQGLIPNSATNLLAMAAGAYYSLGLRPDGRIASWGDS